MEQDARCSAIRGGTPRRLQYWEGASPRWDGVPVSAATMIQMLQLSDGVHLGGTRTVTDFCTEQLAAPRVQPRRETETERTS